jgi:catechol 2,3-dioxygenase-like lactoylglutathione lyase family enzyme
MEQRLTLITLGVSDLGRATAFYRDVLGWTKKDGPDGVAFFDLNGLIFALFPHEDLAKDMKMSAESLSDYRGFTLAYNARSEGEVDQIFAGLKASGVTILKEPEKVFWGGYSGYFADLDGHHWEVAFNPHWTVLSDGRVSMQPPK